LKNGHGDRHGNLRLKNGHGDRHGNLRLKNGHGKVSSRSFDRGVIFI
jgi:hypothetical protein